MKLLLCIALVTGCLTGCSELRIIGTAAMKELRSDVINAEMASYKQADVDAPVAKPEVKRVMVAKNYITTASKQKSNRKGAWEHL